jgi:NADPH2:quinone reductase
VQPVAVGTAAIQIAKAAGARVIAAASTDEKCALCKSLGLMKPSTTPRKTCGRSQKPSPTAKAPTSFTTPWVATSQNPPSGRLPGAAATWWSASLQAPYPALPFNLALLKGASIVGVFWGDFARREPQTNAAMMAELAKWYAQGKVKPVIDRTMPMSDLKAAYAHVGSRGVMGKLVMVN